MQRWLVAGRRTAGSPYDSTAFQRKMLAANDMHLVRKTVANLWCAVSWCLGGGQLVHLLLLLGHIGAQGVQLSGLRQLGLAHLLHMAQQCCHLQPDNDSTTYSGSSNMGQTFSVLGSSRGAMDNQSMHSEPPHDSAVLSPAAKQSVNTMQWVYRRIYLLSRVGGECIVKATWPVRASTKC